MWALLAARLHVDDGASDEELLYKASLAIVIGLLFDGADGRIARLTKTQSDLGMQLDSLADVITFGLQPKTADLPDDDEAEVLVELGAEPEVTAD